MSKLTERALQLELKGRLEEAATLYLQAAKPEKAAYLFQKAGQADRALEILTQERLWRRAADMTFKLQRFIEAGEFYERAGDTPKAVDAYSRGQAYNRAADLLEKENDKEKAAKLYIKAGNYLKAGSAFEALGQGDNAIMAYRRFLVEQGDTGKSLSRSEARRIAKIFEKADEPDKAAALMLKAGEFEQAFHMAIESGNNHLAGEIYLKHFAGEGYHLLSGDVTSRDLLIRYGKFFLANNDPDVASSAFERAEAWEEAAQAYEKAGNNERGADLYYKAGSYENAARLYEKSGQYRVAGDIYYKMKKLDKAAENYEKDGVYYKAGRLYQFLGNNEHAVSILQKIPPDDPEYMKATGIIAQAFIHIGLPDIAKKRLDEVLNNYSLAHDNLPFFLEIAQALVKMKAYERAKKILEEILTIDFSMEEARNLLLTLKKMAPQEPAKPPAASQPQPAPSPPPVASATGQESQAPLRLSRAMQTLKKFNFFSHVREEDIPEIWPLIQRTQVKDRDVILPPGARAVDFYLLAKGKVEIISALGRALGEITESGSIFGFVASLSGAPSTAGFRSVGKSALLRINAAKLMTFFQSLPRTGKKTALTDHILFYIQEELNHIPHPSLYHEQAEAARKRVKAFFKNA